ncbi:TetR/AcrR family transcriptional regulator [Actinomadura sp. KC216]|nr:TetR/AcrR family transcriptional regulator [Actinomadura sp. KC216]
MLGSGVEKAQTPRPTQRGRKTLAAIEAAARRIIARKGFLTMTVADIAQEAGRSPASFYNYYDSKEDLLAHWADDFRKEAKARAVVAYKHGVPHRERVMESARAHWETYRERLAEMVGVFQLAMINEEFAGHWRELCDDAVQGIAESVRRAQREGYCPGADPELTARAIVAMLNQFCYDLLAGAGQDAEIDDEDAVRTLGEMWYRAIYWRADPA